MQVSTALESPNLLSSDIKVVEITAATNIVIIFNTLVLKCTKKF